MSTTPEYLTFRQAAEKFPAFSESSLRWLRFNGTETEFNRCVIQVGRRVLLDTEAFGEWLKSRRVQYENARHQ